jgi:hypothetical protein
MASRRQIAANRRNAKKSTGPRTAQGKAIARLNNLRNVLFARGDTLPAGSWNEILEIRDRFLLSCQPENIEQYHLVAQVACAEWKLLHWQQEHARLLQEAMEHRGPRRQDRLRREFAARQNRIERELKRAHEDLQRAMAPQPQPEVECLPAA